MPTSSVEVNITYAPRPSDAMRSFKGFVQGLNKAELLETDEAIGKGERVQIPPYPKIDAEGHFKIGLLPLETAIPSTGIDNILDGGYHISITSVVSRYYMMALPLTLSQTPLEICYSYQRNRQNEREYRADMVLKADSATKDRIVLTDEFLPDFTQFFTTYHIQGNEAQQEIATLLHQRRIPAEAIPADSRGRSLVSGKGIGSVFDMNVRLFLQDPNPNSYSKCYEVELAPEEAAPGENTFHPNTTDFVPDAKWQANENHFCMTGVDYPFIPPIPGVIGRLRLSINSVAQDSQIVDLLRGIPLSWDGTNTWFTKKSRDDETVEVIHQSDWGQDKLAFTSHIQSENWISPLRIRQAAEGLLALSARLG